MRKGERKSERERKEREKERRERKRKRKRKIGKESLEQRFKEILVLFKYY